MKNKPKSLPKSVAILILFFLGVVAATVLLVYHDRLLKSAPHKAEIKPVDFSNYFNDGFFIQFNEKNESGLFASIFDQKFRSYFEKDFHSTVSGFREINTTELTYYEITPWVYIKINYKTNTPDKDKELIIIKLTNLFQDKWYTERIQFDSKDHTNG